MADESENFVVGERSASHSPLCGHGTAVIGTRGVGSTFTIWIAIGGDTGGLKGFGSGVHPIQHVFDMGEGFEGLAVFQNSTCST